MVGRLQPSSLVQHKVKQVHTVRITDETRRDLESLSSTLRANGCSYHHTPLHWPHHWSVFYYWLAKARSMVNIDPDVHNRALQHIRRTGATAAVECVERDAGSRYLVMPVASLGKTKLPRPSHDPTIDHATDGATEWTSSSVRSGTGRSDR